MALRTSLVISGEASSATQALDQVDTALERTGNEARRAGSTIVTSTRQAQAGYVNFGRQVQDVAVMLQSGANIGTIIALQGGQVADAVSQMGGRFAGLARFMAGPMGTAVIVLTSSLLNMAQAHWEASRAANDNAVAMKQVELASSGLSDAQSVLGEMFDLTTGKIKEQNERLRLNAELQRLNLKIEADAAREQATATRNSVGGTAFSYFTAGGLAEGGDISVFQQIKASQEKVRSAIDQVIAGKLDAVAALKSVQEGDLSTLNITMKEYRDALVKAVEARTKGATADAITEALEKERLPESLRKPDTSKKSTVDQIAERAEEAARKIANIKDQFSDLPSAVEKANDAMRELDKISSSIERSKIPQTTKNNLKASIEDAGKAVQDSLNRPFEEYLEKSREAADINALLAAGRDEEAAALKVILDLKNKQKPLDEAQRDIVLATVRAEERRSLELRDQRALIQANVDAVHDMREALNQTVADAFKGRFSVDRILSSIGNSYVNIASQRIVEKLFGDTLRSVEELARRGPIDDASTNIATAMKKGETAVLDLARSFATAKQIFDGSPSVATSTASENGGAANDNGGNGGEIVITGRRPGPLAGSDPGSLLVNLLTGLTSDLRIQLPSAVGESVEKGLSKLDKSLPSLLAGAFTGASTSRIILGDRGTGGTLGAAAGGALGQKFGEKFLEKGLSSISSSLGSFAGPIGSIAGGLIGGLIGGIFNKRESASSGAITSVDQPASVSGNSGAAKSEISALSGSVQTSIAQIAKQLNATVGQFSVAIGKYGDYYRVSASGTQNPSAKYFSQHNTNPDSLYDGPDANVALSLAIQNAIGDGAVQGISAAVQRALKSSTNIDAALAEALKVQDLETALGGVTGGLEKAFKDFEAQAKDRLRIARTYGLDIVKTEELNAKQRLALSEKLLADQVGSLQSLVDQINGGSLFEGSAVEKRQAILAQIDKVKADADAGVEGAADKLAQLLEQGLAASKDVYGTTGGYAADRQLLLDAARDTITKANQRVNEAQKASDPALAQTNNLIDESNDQLARIAAQLASIDDRILKLASAGNAPDLEALRRSVAYR